MEKAKGEDKYLLMTKLFCGYCKAMMTGFSGTGKTDKKYHYYTCNGAKKKTDKCKKKMVGKEYIENLVIAECRKLLMDKNIAKIAKEVVAVCEAEKDTTNLRRLKDLLSENQRKHKNLMDAIMECDVESLRKAMYLKAPELEQEHIMIEKEIALEEKNHPTMTVPKIKFFLTSLKNGNMHDYKYRRVLIKDTSKSSIKTDFTNISTSQAARL